MLLVLQYLSKDLFVNLCLVLTSNATFATLFDDTRSLLNYNANKKYLLFPLTQDIVI